MFRICWKDAMVVHTASGFSTWSMRSRESCPSCAHGAMMHVRIRSLLPRVARCVATLGRKPHKTTPTLSSYADPRIPLTLWVRVRVSIGRGRAMRCWAGQWWRRGDGRGRG